MFFDDRAAAEAVLSGFVDYQKYDIVHQHRRYLYGFTNLYGTAPECA